MRDWEASSPGSNPLSPTLAFPVSPSSSGRSFGPVPFLALVAGYLGLGQRPESGESKFGLGRRKGALRSANWVVEKTAIIP